MPKVVIFPGSPSLRSCQTGKTFRQINLKCNLVKRSRITLKNNIGNFGGKTYTKNTKMQMSVNFVPVSFKCNFSYENYLDHINCRDHRV
jgi:hypothetical protein